MKMRRTQPPSSPRRQQRVCCRQSIIGTNCILSNMTILSTVLLTTVLSFILSSTTITSTATNAGTNSVLAFTISPSSPRLAKFSTKSSIERKSTSSSSKLHSTKPFFADFSTNNNNNNNCKTINHAEIMSSNKIGSGKTAIVAGASGYIGRAVVRECLSRGYHTIALVRNSTYILDTVEGWERYGEAFGLERPDDHRDDVVVASRSDKAEEEGRGGAVATVLECDVCNENQVAELLKKIANESNRNNNNSNNNNNIDILISCLASASGTESEVYAVDYSATLNLLNAGRHPSVNARHFLLLSAFCCRNPLLKLQQAKLEFESKLQSQEDLTYSIIRPTAFFKSVSGQLESIRDGNSYVLFGDGAVTQCNPISEEELAIYMMDSALEEFKERRWGRILNIGGPDEPLSNKMLGEMMFKAINKPPKFVYVPTWIFDLSISMIESIAKTFPSQKWEDALETAKIGKYYAVEDMLTTEPDEKFGTMTMMSHFQKIANEGQDPFTPVRATAFISKALEALPAISISIPLGFGLLTKPGIVETVVASSPLASVPMLIAQLNENIFS